MKIVLHSRDAEERDLILSGRSNPARPGSEMDVMIDIEFHGEWATVDCHELKTAVEALETSVRQRRKL